MSTRVDGWLTKAWTKNPSPPPDPLGNRRDAKDGPRDVPAHAQTPKPARKRMDLGISRAPAAVSRETSLGELRGRRRSGGFTPGGSKRGKRQLQQMLLDVKTGSCPSTPKRW